MLILLGYLPNKVLNKILKYINGYVAKTTPTVGVDYFQADIERIIREIEEGYLKHFTGYVCSKRV